MKRLDEVSPRETPRSGRAGASGRLWAAGIAMLVGGVLANLAALTTADPDLWGHVRFGQLATLLGGPVRRDPFSYLSSGHVWINHEWLSELIFARVWDALHTPGLVALKAAIVLLLLLLVYRRLWREGPGPLRGGLVLVGLAIPSLVGLGTVRPQLFTYLGFVVTLLVLVRAEEGRERWLWALPVVFAAWINLHGGVLAGVGVLGVWTAARLAIGVRDRLRARPGPGEEGPAGPPLPLVVAVALLSLAALLLNPYGWKLPAFLLRTATVPRPDISEWHPVRITSSLGFLYMAYVAGGAWVLGKSSRPRRPALLAVLAVVALLPLTAVRHLPLFGLALGILLAPDLRSALGRDAGRAPRGRLAGWLGAAAAVVGLLAGARSVSSFRCIEMGPEHSLAFPARAVAVLDRSGASGNLATFFNWGEYAIWHLSPPFRVGMDGRRETVYPDSVYRSYLSWSGGTGDWDRYLEAGSPDLALVARSLPVYSLMKLQPGWSPVYADSVAAVFGRDGSAAAGRVRAAAAAAGPRIRSLPADGQGLCFP